MRHNERVERRLITPRDVWTVVWVVLLTATTLWLLFELKRLLIWLLIAGFLAAVLAPVVDWLQRRGVRRGLAVGLVVTSLLIALTGLIYLFVEPLIEESQNFAENLPEIVEEVRDAPIVKQVLERFNVESNLEEASSDLPQRLVGLSGPLLTVFKTVGEVIIGTLTIFVLMIFFLLYGPQMVAAGQRLIDRRDRREYAGEVGRDILSAVSGWVAGNVLTSFIAAIVALIVFLIAGLPYAVLLSAWVGVADLIPLIGASLGALPAIIVAFLESTPVGIGVTIFFIAYQQFENHILQPYVYGRTIRLNPFVVLVAVLAGVEIAGFLGALLALPFAGAAQVVVESITRGKLPRGKAEPSPSNPQPSEP